MTHTMGLEGVVAAQTRLSHVDGERGELIIAGYPLADFATHATFEEATWLLWHGRRPTAAELAVFHRELAGKRALPPATMALVKECAGGTVDAMDALRIAAGTISLAGEDAMTIA